MRNTLADLWIFGYGSLIFKADFPYLSRQPATLKAWNRRFWQASSDHRGTPESPGRVVTLIEAPESICWGMAYLIDADQSEQVLDHLDYREKGGYQRLNAPVHLEDGRQVEAITYLADRSNPEFLGESSIEDMAYQIHHAAGPSGSNRDYLFQLEHSLINHGVSDTHVFDLAAAVRTL